MHSCGVGTTCPAPNMRRCVCVSADYAQYAANQSASYMPGANHAISMEITTTRQARFDRYGAVIAMQGSAASGTIHSS
jgi:hypothetical protein